LRRYREPRPPPTGEPLAGDIWLWPDSRTRLRTDPSRVGHRHNGNPGRYSTLIIQPGRRSRTTLNRRSHFAVDLATTAASSIHAETRPGTLFITHPRGRLLVPRAHRNPVATLNPSPSPKHPAPTPNLQVNQATTGALPHAGSDYSEN